MVVSAVADVASVAATSVSSAIEREGAADVDVVFVVCVEEVVVKEDGEGDVRADDAMDDCG